MAAYYYDLHDNEKRNFVHVAIAEEWEIGLTNPGGPTLKTRIQNPNIATVISDVEVSPGVSKVKFRGKAHGNTLVHGLDPEGNEVALTQFVIRRMPMNARLHDLDSGTYSELELSTLGTKKDPEILIALNLLFQQDAPGLVPDSDARPFTAQAWGAAEWANFKASAKRQGERKFNGRFWLRTPNQYFPLCKNGYRYHVACRFQVNLVTVSVAPFTTAKTIKVIKVLPNKQNFRSDSSHYANYDINQTFSQGPDGKSYGQVTVVHEMWHALGGDHIGKIKHNRSCPTSNTNAPACYCASPSDCGNIAGMGMAFLPLNGSPWQNRIAEHTDTSPSDWKISMKRIPPDSL